MILKIIIIKLVFKVSILKAIIAEFIPFIVTLILDMLLYRIYLSIFGTLYETIITIPIYRITLALIINLIMYILYRIMKRYTINITMLDNMNSKSKKILLVNLILSLLVIGIQYYITATYHNLLPNHVILLNLITIISYFIVNLYSLSKTTKLELATQNLEQSKQYNKTLSILHDNIRGFKHDFNNIVTTIGGYVQMNDMNGLKQYYNDLVDDCQKVNNLNTLSPDVINNPAIYTLLTTKYYTADEKGIKINLEIFLDLNSLNMKIYEFTRILGILLDNAIEATTECEEKIINLIIRKDEKAKRQLLIIENTYLNKNIDTEKIFEKGHSSKTAHTGLGLWEVRQILKKNNNLNLYTTKNDKFFKQQLEIYKK